MAQTGTMYSKTVLTSADPDQVTQEIATRLAGVSTNVSVPQSGTVIATRSSRPGWAIILAVLCSLLFLVGLLFLLVKQTQTVTVRTRPSGRRTRVEISGTADVDMIVAINGALRALPDLTDENGGAVEIRDPKVLAGPGLMMGAGATPATISEPKPAVPPSSPRFAEDDVAPASPGGVCGTCDEPVAPENRFCGTCGTEYPEGCTFCGEPLGGERFCTACGTPTSLSSPAEVRS